MIRHHLVPLCLTSLLALTACQGDSSCTQQDLDSGSAQCSGTRSSEQWQLGSGSPFQSGRASVALETLAASGTTQISVEIRDRRGRPYPDPIEVAFSSACSQQAVPLATLTSPVLAQQGIANSTYRVQGCTGSDSIQVSAQIDGQDLTATASLTILPTAVGNLQFVSAQPSWISLPGGSGATQALLTFQVLDSLGQPMSGQLVDFSLTSVLGGLTLEPTFATSDSAGHVSTFVQAGTAATVVQVLASLRDSDPLISSQSTSLTVSSGIADQDSFTLSADVHNPEAWSFNGVTVDVTARAADRFNHPVPDGTAILFYSEGGTIQPQCLTQSGVCSVQWTSQNPRPVNGRVTVLATTVGAESFPDLNSNGRFDADELTAFRGTNVAGAPYDLAEAFVDYNENSTLDGIEPYLDFNQNNLWDPADTLYNGPHCAVPAHAGCSPQTSAQVRAALQLVMSGSQAVITASTSQVTLAADTSAEIQVCISDERGQPMPYETTVSFSVEDVTITNEPSYTWLDTNQAGARCTPVRVSAADVEPPVSAILLVTVTTPEGIVTRREVATISVP